MKLEGDLRDIRLIPHLLELAETRFTGAIRFENDGIIKILYFKDGDVLTASTNDRADSVDEILLRAGKINRDHVRQALGKRKDNETLGDALLALGYIAKKELVWARRVQVVGIVRSVDAWPEGTFQVVQDYLPKREEGTLFYLPQIILELIVTDPDRARVERELDGGAAVLRKAPGFDDRYGRLALNEDADAILRQVDGERSAAEIAAATQLEAFAVYKLLLALQTVGVLESEKAQGMDEVFLPPPAAPEPIIDPAVEPLPAHDDSFGLPEPEPEGESFGEPLAVPSLAERDVTPPAEAIGDITHRDRTLRRTSSRNSFLFLIAAFVILALGAWGGWAWWGSRGVGDPGADPAAVPLATITEPEAAAPEAPAEATVEPAPVETAAPPAIPDAASQPPAQQAAPASPPPVDLGDPVRQRYQRMAEEYARSNADVPYAVQFGIFCQTDSVTGAIAAGEEVWFTPIRFRGQPCFRLFWGRYASASAAERGAGEIPATLRGADPVVVRPREILR